MDELEGPETGLPAGVPTFRFRLAIPSIPSTTPAKAVHDTAAISALTFFLQDAIGAGAVPVALREVDGSGGSYSHGRSSANQAVRGDRFHKAL